MNIVCKCALVGASLIFGYACATPVSIDDDVLLANPNDFGDGGILPGTGGTTVGTGGTGSGVGGTGSSVGGTGSGVGGTASNVGGTGAGVGGTGASVGGTGSGTGGTGAGVGGTGTGGTGAGTGGTGTGGTGAGTGGTGAGTGGTGSAATFKSDCDATDFNDLTGCETLACLAGCAGMDGGGNCSTRCQALIDCVTTDPGCTITEADPLCAARAGSSVSACTNLADSAGGADTTQTTQPAFVARQFVECICSVPRP